MKILFFEGIDGIGKSTVIRDLLKKKNYITLQPEIDRFKVFSYPPEIKSELLKSTASMFFNTCKMLNDSTRTVVVDRFIWSEYVYSCLRGVRSEWVIELSKKVFKTDLKARIVYLYTGKVENFEKIRNRIKHRKKDSHITANFLQDSQAIYETLFGLLPEDRIVRINTDGKTSKQLSDIISKL